MDVLGPGHIILLIIHIVSAGLWFAQFPLDFVMGRLVKTNEGKPSEAALLVAHLRAGTVLGQIAGPLVLLSGLGLLVVWHWGLFGLTATTPVWLIVKQVVYVILMGIVGAVITPNAKRIGTLVTELTQGKDASPVTPDMRAAYSRIMLVSRITGLLVLLNIIIGKFAGPPS
ncbi:MAG: hypothetical protein H7175_07420 [Burkholderiales bacterium]|nr:hypothetical protein [Anaerolineae bacterium]